MPTMLAMLTMRPQRRLIIPRDAARMARNAPRRLASRTVSQSSSLMRNRMLSRVSPALFTRMSIWPNAFSTDSTSAVMDAGSPTSAPQPPAPPPPAPARAPPPRGLTAPDHGHARAGAGERFGDGAPDAARAARDEGG